MSDNASPRVLGSSTPPVVRFATRMPWLQRSRAVSLPAMLVMYGMSSPHPATTPGAQ